MRFDELIARTALALASAILGASLTSHTRRPLTLPRYMDFDTPTKNPRRGPNCGAPTPTPVPLRIS
jgi:hypothetical protein